MNRFRLAMGCAVAVFASGEARAGIIVHTSDFIADGTRTNFMGFEGLPSGVGAIHIEDGLRIEQVNGASGIWTTFFHPEGDRGWYPNGGDWGYTRITLVNGGDFDAIGLFYASGFARSTLLYALRNDGMEVESGMIPNVGTGISFVGYLGFSGGGFDEVWLRDTLVSSPTFLDGTGNALAVDAIETANTTSAVPEPSSMALLGIGLFGLASGRIRRRRRCDSLVT